ncbi:MAG: PAS domain S-box protein [Ignavibacteriae bacterium]|nr:PAS domain S-box protein [Ignavibacteriota bacterium]
MQSNSEIEKFIERANINLHNLFEVLPVGAIFISEKWNVISINSIAQKIICQNKDIQIDKDANIFSHYFLSSILPLNKILGLKSGNNFEEEINELTNIQNSSEKIFIKGISFIEENNFKGGLLLFQKVNINSENNFDVSNQYSISQLLRNICSCYLIADLSGKIILRTDSNDTCSENINSSGNTIESIFNNEQNIIIKKFIERAIAENSNQNFELIFYSDIETFTYKTVIVPLNNNKGDVISLLFLFKEKNYLNNDTAEYLSNAKELQIYKTFTSAGSEAFFKTNLNGIITYWSNNAELLFIKKNDDVVDQFLEEIFPELNKNNFDKLRSELITLGSWEGELKHLINGTEFAAKTKVKLHKTNRFSELLFYCDKVNVQLQKLNYAKEEENNFFRETVLKSYEMILQANPYGTILFANEKFCNIFGYELDEIRGIAFLDLVDRSYRLENDLSDFSTAVYKKSFEHLPMITKLGKMLDIKSNTNISLSGTNLKYFTIYLSVIDYGKQLDSEISETLLENFPGAIAVLKHNFIIELNKTFEELIGSKLYLLNNGISKIINPNFKEEFEKFIIDEKQKHHENLIPIITEDGKEIEVRFEKIYINKEKNIVVLSIDSESLKLKEKFEESKKYSNEFANFDQVFWKGHLENSEIIIDSFTESIEKITGYKKYDFAINKDLWKDIVHPDDFENFDLAFTNFINDDKENLRLEYRIISKSGIIVWISNRIKKIKSKENLFENFIGIIDNITESVLSKEELNKKISELEKLNNTKDKFISIISHDLKAPFTSIVGFAELGFTQTDLTVEEMKEYFGYITNASIHTLDLINSLLDWTRLQTGRLVIKPTTVNANYLVRKTTEILTGFAAQKNISVNVKVDENIFVQADEGILTQVFNNLVSNSIKFTEKGGSINISARKLDDQQKVEFIVKDSGVGIEQEDIKKLFLVEEKHSTLGTEGERGTGLGLSLVKEIVEKHNGKIYVKSEVNVGTEFIFTIPISTPSILLIDDKQTERVIYSKLIESLTDGILVYTASNFEEAKKIINDKMPMLVISESNINGINSSDFYKLLNNNSPRYIPTYFVLTRKISKEEFDKCRNIGVDGIQTKPIEIKLLKSILDTFILGVK